MQLMPKIILSALTAATLHTALATPAAAGERIILDPKLRDAIRTKPVQGIDKLRTPEFVLKADLVVTPAYAGNGPHLGSGYCGGSTNHEKVSMRVKNIGAVASAGSVVKVDFGPMGVGTVGVPGLAPGVTYTTHVYAPNHIANTWLANFNIKVDANNTVTEKSENNNFGAGQCLIAGATDGNSGS